MTVKLLAEHHSEFISLKGGCTGSSESTFVKQCWKSHAAANVIITSSDGYCRMHMCLLDWLHNRYASLNINPSWFSHLPFCTTRAVLLDSSIQFCAVNLVLTPGSGWTARGRVL